MFADAEFEVQPEFAIASHDPMRDCHCRLRSAVQNSQQVTPCAMGQREPLSARLYYSNRYWTESSGVMRHSVLGSKLVEVVDAQHDRRQVTPDFIAKCPAQTKSHHKMNARTNLSYEGTTDQKRLCSIERTCCVWATNQACARRQTN